MKLPDWGKEYILKKGLVIIAVIILIAMTLSRLLSGGETLEEYAAKRGYEQGESVETVAEPEEPVEGSGD